MIIRPACACMHLWGTGRCGRTFTRDRSSTDCLEWQPEECIPLTLDEVNLLLAEHPGCGTDPDSLTVP